MKCEFCERKAIGLFKINHISKPIPLCEHHVKAFKFGGWNPKKVKKPKIIELD